MLNSENSPVFNVGDLVRIQNKKIFYQKDIQILIQKRFILLKKSKMMDV